MHTILLFLKKHALLLIVLVVFIAIMVFKFLKRKPKDMSQTGADILESNGVTGLDVQRLNKVSKDVAHHLGTAYPWYDPRHWTENDEKVFDLLKDLSHDEFALVSTLYHDVYAKGSTLSSDLSRLLDDEYYRQLPF